MVIWFKSKCSNISIVLIGNKPDLEEERKITTEQGKEKAEFFIN